MMENVFLLLDKHFMFVKRGLLFSLSSLTLTLLYLMISYLHSFQVHQKRLETVLRCNHRESLYCSQVHVGHDGTTLSFQVIPEKVGTAGPIEAIDLVLGGDPCTAMDPILIPLLLFLVLIIMILSVWVWRSTRKEREKKKGEEKKGEEKKGE